MSAVSKPAFSTQAYRRVLDKTLPRPIQNDADLETMTGTLMVFDELIEDGKATVEQKAVAELLTILIEKYENEHYPVLAAAPHERLAAVLEHRGLGQKDLAAILESRSMASLILSGKRAISKAQMKLLAERFKVPADFFL